MPPNAMVPLMCAAALVFVVQRAEAQLAYELQVAKTRQKIRNEEIQIEVVERRKQIEVSGRDRVQMGGRVALKSANGRSFGMPPKKL